jgi:hypothetical protein
MRGWRMQLSTVLALCSLLASCTLHADMFATMCRFCGLAGVCSHGLTTVKAMNRSASPRQNLSTFPKIKPMRS